MVFSEPVYFRCAHSNDAGLLLPGDHTCFRQGAVNELDDLVYDYFELRDDRIQWIAEIRAWRGESVSLYLMVDCAHVSVEDRQESALNSAFGNAALQVWRALPNHPNPDWDDFANDLFWEAKLGELGLTKGDFVSSIPGR